MKKQYIRKNIRINKVESLTYEYLNSFNFFERYEKMCKSHRSSTDLTMDNPDMDRLLDIVKKCGYIKSKKSSKKTIVFNEKINNDDNIIKFYIGQLNIGQCEFQIYFNSKEDEYILGDVGCGMLILKSYVEDNDFTKSYTPYPNFTTYEEFQIIFKEFARLYEDFKKAIIESGIRTLSDVEDIIE